jgi:hypothetical protein
LRAGKAITFILVSAVTVTAGSVLSAHRLDECLQAARIAVEPTRVELELDLTPGIAVAETIISDIDRDADGTLSMDEQQAYARRVLAATALDIDGRALQVRPGPSTFPDVTALRRGEGIIRLQSTIDIPSQTAGPHHVRFRNAYRSDISVYLANALVPESRRVGVTAQRHDASQRDLTIEYVVHAAPASSLSLWLLGGFTLALSVLVLRPARTISV